ncbi:MAG TPA: peptide deformylase [Candidatus Rhabdochlamydia sp.]|jgi:peptide deformylase|nr:peptide deformylase [Candidatus Rhabdochlamydia sp.]
MIKENNVEFCPCSSGLSYQTCCQPLHNGALAKNALMLMRARYAAYVLDLSSYIIKTTHPASPQYFDDREEWVKEISHFSKTFQFNRLEMLSFKEKEKIATVTFVAHISQNDQDATFTERSYFEKIKDQWLYKNGQLCEGRVPNLMTTEQLKVLPLAYYDDPILRKKAEPITAITEDVKNLVEEMKETMDACNGIGLAAPQVHHSIRLFIIREPTNKELDKNKVKWGEVKVFINPKISFPSKKTWKESEGCLSIPNIYADVERAQEITVEYMNIEGKNIKQRISGWEARVVLHENDHIDGILFIDRLNQQEAEKLTPFLENLKKRIHNSFML